MTKRNSDKPNSDRIIQELFSLLARYYLDLRDNHVFSGDLINWALTALEAGYDSPSLITLAGLNSTAPISETSPYFFAAISQLDLRVPEIDRLKSMYVVALCLQIIENPRQIDWREYFRLRDYVVEKEYFGQSIKQDWERFYIDYDIGEWTFDQSFEDVSKRLALSVIKSENLTHLEFP